MTRKVELRCVHRQDIEHHPACFRKGLIKYPNDRAFERYGGKPWYQFDGYRIGYFDIETDNLNADWGTILTWCIKEKDGPIAYSINTKKELFDEKFDERLVAEFLDELKKYKIIVGYYSTGFDLGFMRAKALHYGMEFPGYELIKDEKNNWAAKPELYHWDLYYTVKSKLKISRRSLDNACDYLGIEGKTPISKNAWRYAKYGNPDALEEVLKHNIGDVDILEQLHNKLEFAAKWYRRGV